MENLDEAAKERAEDLLQELLGFGVDLNTIKRAIKRAIKEQQQQIDALKAHIQTIENLSVWSWMSAALNDSKVCDEMKDDINRAFNVIGNPEQSLAEHDREIYNKAIEDVLALDHDCVGYKLTIRQLYKESS